MSAGAWVAAGALSVAAAGVLVYAGTAERLVLPRGRGAPSRRETAELWAARLGMVVLLLVPFVPLVWRAASDGPTESRRSRGRTMVVMDVSGSITAPLSNAFARTLSSLSADDPRRRAGLVVFSDGAQLVMPPTVTARDLARFSRYFRTGPARPPDVVIRRARDLVPGMYPSASPNPWANAWLGGTSIGQGLDVADRALGRERGGSILLVSDLHDGESPKALGTALTRLAAHGRRLALVPVGASSGDVASYVSRGAVTVSRPTLAAAAIRDHASTPGRAAADRARALAVVLAALIVAALAWRQAPLRLPRPERGAAP